MKDSLVEEQKEEIACFETTSPKEEKGEADNEPKMIDQLILTQQAQAR